MTDCCESAGAITAATDHAYRRVLYIVLALNVIMFLVESVAGYIAGSAALQADAIDFLGDSLNFISALYVLNKSPRWKSGAAMVKGGVIGLFGLFVLGNTLYHWLYGALPQAGTMGIIGILALVVNAGCAGLLFHFRKGDSNRSAVWICSRNDAIANILVIGAGILVYFTGSKWPDLAVSFIIAALALSGAVQIIGKAKKEWHL
ncbi:MAG: cation transporter [Pseudomonadota bacterium]|nr:cation transporter [Pseudomonadota bacterium]MDE3037147.1 cation transporter [Pseudomonadota bacterium]